MEPLRRRIVSVHRSMRTSRSPMTCAISSGTIEKRCVGGAVLRRQRSADGGFSSSGASGALLWPHGRPAPSVPRRSSSRTPRPRLRVPVAGPRGAFSGRAKPRSPALRTAGRLLSRRDRFDAPADDAQVALRRFHRPKSDPACLNPHHSGALAQPMLRDESCETRRPMAASRTCVNAGRGRTPFRRFGD